MWIIWDAAVDYVTSTVAKENSESKQFADLGRSLLLKMASDGHTEKSKYLFGYQGWESGNVFAGRRDDGEMVRVSSAAAHPYCVRLTEDVPTARITRLDLQITARGEVDQPTRAEDIYHDLRAKHRAKHGKKPFRAKLDVDEKNGSTLWLGSRTSPRFYRIYDKTREQRGRIEKNLWRYEIEFKGKQAQAIFNTLRLSNCAQKVCIEIVVAGFQSRSVNMDWVDKCDVRKLPSTYSKTTTERKLNWIENNVSRTSKELIQAGYKDMLAHWLGFDTESGSGEKQ
jgi:DNA relaxase NicK